MQKSTSSGDAAHRAHTVGMQARLHHVVVDAHDLPGLARSWTQALGWKILSERENEIVIGTDENAPVGTCFMPVIEPKWSRTACISTSPAAPRTAIRRLTASGARCAPGRHRAGRSRVLDCPRRP